MAENLGKWPSKRGPITKVRSSDGCESDTVLLVVDRWFDFPEFGCHLGNVGTKSSRDNSGARPIRQKGRLT